MLVDLLNTTMPEFDKINESIQNNFLNKEKFALEIETIVNDTKMNYIDAIVEYCNEHGIEIESVGKLMSKPLKEKLRLDATELNYLKGSDSVSRAKLPF